MATIWWEESVAVPAEHAWAALRRVDIAHILFSPVLVNGVMDGDVRIVTFADGLVVRERIITVDERRRRIVYSVLGDRFEHHSASMQICPVDDTSCRFIWISDFLPDERIERVQPHVEEGSRALARNIEGGKAVAIEDASRVIPVR
jgi:hypothetical protein